MSVSGHLQIQNDEYDDKIRTFVPYYERMIELIADSLALIRTPEPTFVDLGIGTGALTHACLQVLPRSRAIGIDIDEGMMHTARTRLKDHPTVEYVAGNFMVVDLPPADAMVACISLHHILTPLDKQRFYRRCYQALAPGGMLVSGDCFPAVEPSMGRRHRLAWLQHLQRTYSPSESEAFLQAWSGEDVYFPLEDEMSWLRGAGFRAEVIWRKDGFAVMCGFRER